MEVINSVKAWFVEAVPVPTERNKAVQLGVHLEEVGEMLLACDEGIKSNLVDHWGFELKSAGKPPERVHMKELADSLGDQIVTAVGVAHMYGIDIVGVLTEVDRANWSKFVDGKAQFDANGKIAKSANYTPPDLTPFLPT
jgi:predicted HAD superfamily Cof-like phosphohydrolase